MAIDDDNLSRHDYPVDDADVVVGALPGKSQVERLDPLEDVRVGAEDPGGGKGRAIVLAMGRGYGKGNQRVAHQRRRQTGRGRNVEIGERHSCQEGDRVDLIAVALPVYGIADVDAQGLREECHDVSAHGVIHCAYQHRIGLVSSIIIAGAGIRSL